MPTPTPTPERISNTNPVLTWQRSNDWPLENLSLQEINRLVLSLFICFFCVCINLTLIISFNPWVTLHTSKLVFFENGAIWIIEWLFLRLLWRSQRYAQKCAFVWDTLRLCYTSVIPHLLTMRLIKKRETRLTKLGQLLLNSRLHRCCNMFVI